ncbi:hypothetical protein HRbin17_00750 [bacterium HR17]|uniref:LPS-assembly protein LptD n=1 Tax=Candidatus Fervidibacter japonicus TaxID=2035412 RepID=A0A2H5XAN4_9BACT|nr:hypothetical protein HRbin17_00750 [bacterium HR17]
MAGAVTRLGRYLLMGCCLTSCVAAGRCQMPQEMPPSVGSLGDTLRVESELPLRYEPQTEEWRTAEGTGLVRLTYRNFTLFTRRLRYRRRDQIVEASEGVRLLSQRGLEFVGGRIVYDLGQRQWTMDGGKATMEPSFFGAGVAEPLYLTVHHFSGTEQRWTAEQATLSSCDRPVPHYSLRAESVEILPNDRLILRHIGVFLGDRKIIGLGRYTISIKPRRQRSRLPFTPDFGYDRLGGVFVKTTISLLDTRAQTVNLLLDLSQQRGTGYGLEHSYNFRQAQGDLSLFLQRSPFLGRERTFSWRHQQTLFAGLLLTTFWDDRRNAPFLGGQVSSTVQQQFSLRRNWLRGATELALRAFRYGNFTDERVWTFSHTFSTVAQSLNLLGTLRQTRRPGQATDEELTERVEVRRRLSDTWDWALRFEQRVDLDREKFLGDTTYALDRLPEITFTFRPHQPRFTLPFIVISLARWREPRFLGFNQPVQTLTTERVHLRMETPTRTVRVAERLSLTHSALFEQFLYGNDTAQYLYGYRGSLAWELGGQSRLDLDYWRQRVRGFTPFTSDLRTNYENLDLRLSLAPSDRFLLSLTTGLDVRNNFYRDALLNLRWRPYQGAAVDLSTGYSLERGQWLDLLGRIVLSKPSTLGVPTYGTFVSYYGIQPTPFAEERPAPPPGGFRSELTFRYSPTQGRLALARLFMDWSVSKSWRLETLLGYSGLLRKMDIVQFRVTRDLHCYQLWLTYNRERREFRFFFVVKAFPLFQQLFGTSNQGTFLDTSVGQFY